MSTKRDSIINTLHQTLASCSSLIEAGDYSKSQQSISEHVDFLNSVSSSILSESENEDSEKTALEILAQIHQYISLPTLNQDVIDALAFEWPKAVAKFACRSKRCLETAESIIDRLVETCSPRDMLSILCEALGSQDELFAVPRYFIPLLSGLTKVLVSIQRRHYEQVKAAVPVILSVFGTISSESDDEDTDFEELFCKAIDIANSIQEVRVKLEGKDSNKLRALLGLYVLQIMALVSIGLASKIASCLQLVLQLFHFLQHCELSYIGLITGCEVDVLTELDLGEDGDEYMNCFSQVKLGASLAVIWAYKSNEVAIAAKADLAAIKSELQGNWFRRWEAIGMLKHIFSCVNLPWELKKYAIKFLLCIMDGIMSHSYDDHVDYSAYMPTLYTGLQAIEMVIMYASDATLRKDAFGVFKKVIADTPTSLRFDVLRALIKNSDSSSMIAILLDYVRGEMHVEKTKRISLGNAFLEQEVHESASFWSPSVLELMEFVLRPPEGGPPSLPEYSDAVLSALNFYRFILITESTGNSNYTGILSKDNLRKAYNEWLLPLRTLLAGTMAENQKVDFTSDTICALNPVEFVLYRCIELVEEKLKHL
ncbi:aberrant lateral root formation 4 [Forsythia ovata]|uniref:Aberrant lateral root formation 4 n=1 Tax=Forsythia ovata TaxID=205694 RepID=A0ABD1UXT0_9LAMI